MRRAQGGRGFFRICQLGGILAFLVPDPARTAAHRIASTNLCTDQLALMLADPKDIVGLSPLARDCDEALLCAEARRVPTIRANAEAILAIKPDLVLGGTYTALVTQQILRQAGLNVEMFPPVENLDDVPAQIAAMAKAIGRPERAAPLIEAYRLRLAALSEAPRMPGDGAGGNPSAVIYAAHGFVTRRGSLPDDLLTRAGFRNLADTPGYGGSLGVPLERLIADSPDLLILDRSAEGVSLAQGMLDNPELRASFPPPHRLDVSARLWICALPQTLDVLASLRAAREALRAR